MRDMALAILALRAQRGHMRRWLRYVSTHDKVEALCELLLIYFGAEVDLLLAAAWWLLCPPLPKVLRDSAFTRRIR